MKTSEPKPKQCAMCHREFWPRSSLHSVCSQRCAMKKLKAKAVEEKAELKARKEAIKTLPQLKREAQIEFNAYIRARDARKPCICCGKPLGENSPGGAFDCGHYRSVGSAPQLRFDERNAHAQRKQCNRWGAGRAVDYRLGLIARIGLEAVESLEQENEVKKWTRQELIEIRATYRAKRKALEST